MDGDMHQTRVDRLTCIPAWLTPASGIAFFGAGAAALSLASLLSFALVAEEPQTTPDGGALADVPRDRPITVVYPVVMPP
jgi:hypothetical protein